MSLACRTKLRRSNGPSDQLRDFWFRQFRKQLEAECNGVDPIALEQRWLALDAMTWADRGPRTQIALTEDVRHFLDDADIRSKDHAYAEEQRRRVRLWLDAQ